MSAIYGQIDLLGKEIDGNQAKSFEKYYGDFAVDSINTITTEGKNAFLGCAKQNFYPGAEKEKHLYETENEVFTADAVIDNDMEIRLDAISDLRGPFAFAIYNKKESKVILAVDHFAQRCLFYTIREGRVYFSTLMLPLIRLTGLSFEENQRWIVDCISMRAPVMITEPKETSKVGIYKVVSGTYLEIYLDSNGQVKTEEHSYYFPAKKVKVDKSITLADSERMIRETMSMVIDRIIRPDTKMATQLSCGLDSSTVACIAARKLAAKGEKLHSYTSIPTKEAGLVNKGGVIYDETEGVMEIVKAYPNIEPSFIDTAGRTYLKEVEKIVEMWEAPCKSQQNSIWTDEIPKQAAKDGCKIMLTGSTGNCTLSAGDILNTAAYYIKRCRFVKAFHIFDECKILGVSRKRLMKSMAKQWIAYYTWYFDREARDCYKYIATKKSMGEKYDLTKRFHKEIDHFYPFYDMKEMHRQMYMPNANAQIGEIDTKLSLQYGVIQRDPMRTPEVVELCLSLPMECYASTDYDRRLVRVGMEGVVPEKIRHDVLRRGRQSGDNIYRAAQVWEELLPEIKATLYSEEMLRYLDKSILDDYFSRLDKTTLEENSLDALLIIDLYSMGKYIQVSSM